MRNRSHQARGGRLQGEQLDIRFPKRGRPTKRCVLERCGQLQLKLSATRETKPAVSVTKAIPDETIFGWSETLDDALQMTFPLAPLSEQELYAEFCRMGRTPNNRYQPKPFKDCPAR